MELPSICINIPYANCGNIYNGLASLDTEVAISLKGVGDLFTGTAQAGIQYKDGIGFAAGARASAASGRGTLEFQVYGWEIEIGLTGHAGSIGADIMLGYFPDDGFKAKGGASAVLGFDALFRVKPPQ